MTRDSPCLPRSSWDTPDSAAPSAARWWDRQRPRYDPDRQVHLRKKAKKMDLLTTSPTRRRSRAALPGQKSSTNRSAEDPRKEAAAYFHARKQPSDEQIITSRLKELLGNACISCSLAALERRYGLRQACSGLQNEPLLGTLAPTEVSRT